MQWKRDAACRDLIVVNELKRKEENADKLNSSRPHIRFLFLVRPRMCRHRLLQLFNTSERIKKKLKEISILND